MTYDRSRLITPPWGGWDNSSPALFLPHNSFKQITGWLLNKGRIQSFPNFVNFNNPPNGQVWAGARTFEDLLTFLHTGVCTKNNIYYLDGAGYHDQGAPTGISNQPFSIEVFLNRMFFVNGVGNLQWLDGSAGIQHNSDAPGTGFFLSKLNSSLFLLNLFESNQKFPNKIRWSAINNHLEWDTTVDPTAGSSIIPEIEDEITGVHIIRDNMAIYRTAGISILSPTGSVPRFSISNFNTGPRGVGVYYEYTLGNYGDTSIFASEDDIYLFALSTPERIGGPAKKSIFNDLASAVAAPWACQIGQLGPGIDYRSYWLSIPLSGNITSTWVFHFDDKTWVNEQLPYGALNFMGTVAVS